MNVVYVLQHAYETDGLEETKFVGVYSTRARAAAAIERLCQRPGFSEYPDGFHVDEYELDRDHWTEGFFRPDA